MAGLLLGLLCATTRAEQLPLWELGVGVAVLDFADYRGADERSTLVLPLPYVVYRGESFKIDREGLRGLFFSSDRFELDLSVNGTIPVESDKNAARIGMPDLEPTLEIGPTLRVALWHSQQRRHELELRLPVRAAVAPLEPEFVGWLFQPNLNLDVHDIGGVPGWELGMALGPLFADGRYHQYFYGVEPAFATSSRPAYQASGGYSGAQFIASLTRRYDKFWVGGFIRWETLAGATFLDSPLVKREQVFSAGIAAAWIFARSQTLVEAQR